MRAGISQAERQTINLALTKNPPLAKLVLAMAEAAEPLNLSSKSDGALQNTLAALCGVPRTAAEVSIEEMKSTLREKDCLYDGARIWKQLGAKEVPKVPDSVIREAYKRGGRVILQCSSIIEKTKALRAAGHTVRFSGAAKLSDYADAVSEPRWVVVQSQVDQNSLGMPKSYVVTIDNPAPTPGDSFAVRAYARLNGGRQPGGCFNSYEFTTGSGTVVGSDDRRIFVRRDAYYDPYGNCSVGAACFGPSRT